MRSNSSASSIRLPGHGYPAPWAQHENPNILDRRPAEPRCFSSTTATALPPSACLRPELRAALYRGGRPLLTNPLPWIDDPV